MTDALKIVNWFRAKNFADMRTDENAEELTQMKVMKLLYYVQGVYLALYNNRAFSEDIMAWRYGPVVEEVHNAYVGKRGIVGSEISEETRKDYREVQDDEKLSQVVNSVYDAYGSMSAIDLMKQTHQETPWREASQSLPISDKSIRDYFTENIVEDR